MHPEIVKIGKLIIHSYGFMLAASFLFGIWLASYRAKKNNLDSNVISDVGFWIILSAIIGARLYYVVLHFDEFKGSLTGIFNPFHGGSLGIGGLVMYGGVIGALVAGFLFFKIRKLPFLPYADAIAPSVGFGIFLTRIGCFLNGCCYGKGTDAWFGVNFPSISPAGQYQLHEHASHLIPAQLFLSIGGLLIGIIILLVSRKKTFDGFQFYLTVVFYSMLRFSVDFTRHYTADERIATLSHNQIVCIILFIIFAGFILKNFISIPEPVTEQAGNNSEPVTSEQKPKIKDETDLTINEVPKTKDKNI